VRLTVTLLVLIAGTVLLGAWCPQESQVGQEKVIEQFGADFALTLHNLGIADIFHTPWFLSLIALLTVNMVACSVQRVFPKVRSLKQQMPYLKGEAIEKLAFSSKLAVPLSPQSGLAVLDAQLRRAGYKTSSNGTRLVAEFGKFGRLAPTVTHIGLLTLLAGVTISSWTGFSGFQMIPVGGSLHFGSSEHSKLWIGTLPEWRVVVDQSRREDYETGEPKQWYSDLTVVDGGVPVKKQQISVNNPLSYKGVDIYQSSWALDSIRLRFNGKERRLGLRQMGRLQAAFLPLEAGTILIFSVRNQTQPVRVFAKTPAWDAPRMLNQIELGKSIKLGNVEVTYAGLIPLTGLQYKCDPGLPVTYVAFGFIILGVLLAAVPHRQVWACGQEASNSQGGSALLTAGSNGDERHGSELEVGALATVGASSATRAELGSSGLAEASSSALTDTILSVQADNHVAARLGLNAGSTSEGANGCTLFVGGISRKARTAFERGLAKVLERVKEEVGETT